MNRVVKGFLTGLLILVGICFFEAEQSQVYAAEGDKTFGDGFVSVEYTNVKPYRQNGKTAPDYIYDESEKDVLTTWLFAGWYRDAECTSTYRDITADATLAYAKYVPADVLSIRLQLLTGTKASDANTNMRLVSSVDTANYKNVGFEIFFNGKTSNPVVYETNVVYKRITSCALTGVDYNYSPKIMDVESSYFITGTILNIKQANFGKSFYIRPYWNTLDGTKVYGINRFVTVNNGLSGTNVNIPVKTGDELAKNTANVTVEIGGATYNANVAHNDGTYAHLNFDITNRDTVLDSASVVAVKSASNTWEAIHRNLVTTYVEEGNEDTTWYTVYRDKAGRNKYALVTEADLFGLSLMTRTEANYSTTYKIQPEQKFYQVADISVLKNAPKLASEWDRYLLQKSTRIMWEPIGQYRFESTFDGQGHTISGLYVNNDASKIGLFAQCSGAAAVRDFRIKNSYFKGTETSVIGSAVGYASGSISDVYSNAVLESPTSSLENPEVGVGGIIGTVNDKDTSVKNCWFAGDIRGLENVGGIIGYQNGKDNTYVTDCLFDGTIQVSENGKYVGGLIGHAVGSGVKTGVSINDSFSCGSINVGTNATTIGTTIGFLEHAGQKGYTDVVSYYPSQGSLPTVGGHNSVDYSSIKTESDLAGQPLGDVAETLITGWNWRSTWIPVLDGTPILRKFIDESERACIDTQWGANGVYEIENVSDLYGFAYKAKADDFSDITVKVTNDIKVNEGTPDAWGANGPLNSWSSIGYNNQTTNYPKFAGIFDGQGYTISGLYDVSSTDYVGLFGEIAGATIKDIRIEDSYFNCQISNWSCAGSIAARGSGIVDTVYSNATVIGYGLYNGGLFGVPDDFTSFNNCWFDGTLEMKENAQYGGGIVGGVESESGCQITHSLNSGKLSSVIAQGKNAHLGGIIGRIKSKATLGDCLGVGVVTVSSHAGQYAGSVFGYRDGGTLTITSPVYGRTESYSNGYLGHFNGPDIANVKASNNLDLTGINPAAKTNLDFYIKTENADGYWVAVEGTTPILKSFADTDYIDLYTYSVDWYRDEDKNDTIQNLADFRGFAELVKSYDFNGETVTLGADIALNSFGSKTDAEIATTVAGWATNPPANKWSPIGWNSTSNGNDGYKRFAGTFDGNNMTLSGFYVSEPQHAGIFGNVKGAVIQNLRIENSYFASTIEATSYNDWALVGSVAGIGNGTFKNIYSNATLVGTALYTGGIVGCISESAATFSNCQYDGELSLKGQYGRYGGGILGGNLNGGVSTIEHCLNSGTLSGERVYDEAEKNITIRLGGLIGDVGSTTTLTDSLAVGEVNAENAEHVGVVLGWEGDGYEGEQYDANGDIIVDDNATKATLTAYNTYGMTGDEKLLGSFVQSKTVWIDNVSDLVGVNGYKNTQLDFHVSDEDTGYWVVKEDGTPELKVFSDNTNVVSLAGVVRPDLSWYVGKPATQVEYTIADMDDFMGFIEIAKRPVIKGFEGETIKLGADIDLNQGWTAGTTTNLQHIYEPIGWNGNNTSYPKFAGTFDGQGHSISGFYAKLTGNAGAVGLFGNVDGATIKNFKLLNSYVCYAGTDSWGMVGSIAGTGYGTFENVYSNAILENNQLYTGGIIGRLSVQAVETEDSETGDPITTNYSSTSTFNSCWFAGNINLNGDNAKRAGGIVGEISKNSDSLYTTANMTTCLFSGTIISEIADSVANSNALNIGGLAGNCAAVLNLKDCLSAGTITTNGAGYCVRRTLGNMTGTSFTADNSYAASDSYATGTDVTPTSGKVINEVTKAQVLGYETARNTALTEERGWKKIMQGTDNAPVDELPVPSYFYTWYIGVLNAQ